MNNMPTLTTKGVKFNRVDFGSTVSATDVLNYFANEVIQLPIKSELFTIHGPNPEKGAFVIVVCSISEADLTVKTTPTNYADKTLASFGSGSHNVKEDILNKLKPFMLPSPDQLELAMRDPKKRERLMNLGIWGQNLVDINMFSTLRYSPNTGYYVLFLDAEKILRQMCEDPLEHVIPGEFRINTIHGLKNEEIRWDITVSCSNGKRSSGGAVRMEDILRTAR
jgi:hypothetical protein